MADKGVPIRVVSRALEVLKIINREQNMTMMEIARACELPYPTTSRIVQTLIHEGIVTMERDRKTYVPTALAQTLSYGYQKEHAFAAVARPALVELTKKIGWPAAISTRVADSMVVRDSTHSLTTMTLSQYYPGWSVPIWTSASGKIHLAYCEDDERDAIAHSATMQKSVVGEDNNAFGEGYLEEMIETVRNAGYASTMQNRFSKNPGKTSSIAVPLTHNGEYTAALAIIFFSSTMSPKKAAEKYLSALNEAKETIALA